MASDDSNAEPLARRRTPLWLPVVAFLVMIAWSNIPPYRMHILDEDRSLFAWHWKLYQQGGAGICDVRYFDMNNGGEVIERWKLLGYDRPGAMPDKLGRIHHKQLKTDGARVCKAMREQGDPDPNVEVFARCGLSGGWKIRANRKHNVCKAKKAKPKPRKNNKPRTKNKPGASGGRGGAGK